MVVNFQTDPDSAIYTGRWLEIRMERNSGPEMEVSSEIVSQI